MFPLCVHMKQMLHSLLLGGKSRGWDKSNVVRLRKLGNVLGNNLIHNCFYEKLASFTRKFYETVTFVKFCTHADRLMTATLSDT